MKSFLYEVAENIWQKHSENLQDVWIVFPGRRAGTFFQKALSEIAGKTVFAPRIVTIVDLSEELADIKKADDLWLNAKLYNVFKEITGIEEPFDDFIFWGQVILGDFNDIDIELADASKLYRNIADLKEIDNLFDNFKEEELTLIRNFWQVTLETKGSASKEKFMILWNNLFTIYDQFTKLLIAEKKAYSGLIYRSLNEGPGFSRASFSGNHLYFCGFNTLTKAEKGFIRKLKEICEVSFCWDYDNYYFNNPDQEAGFFLRENLQKFNDCFTISHDHFTTHKKDIKVVASPSISGQTKSLTSLLKSFSKTDEKTAIVLADESLLPQVITSLPHDIDKVNITMGYPYKYSQSYTFIESLFELQKNALGKEIKTFFHFKDVIRILSHPFFQWIEKSHDQTQKYTDELKKIILLEKRNWIPIEYLTQETILASLFTRITSTEGWFTWIKNAVKLAYSNLPNEGYTLSGIEKNVLYHLHLFFQKLGLSIENASIPVEKPETLVRIFRQSTAKMTIPFYGEPLSGLQIMGILETRAVDFDNLIILSLNEGRFPSAPSNHSFIPHSLRKGFGLFTPYAHDAVFAYYFYRLLQRATNIRLLYVSQRSDNDKGEPSRFLYQLKYESPHNPGWQTLPQNPGISTYSPITVMPSPLLNNGYIKKQKYLSALSINTFIDCRLKFYLKYIAGIIPPPEISEEIDNRIFGDLLHQILKEIYTPLTGTVVEKDQLRQITSAEVIDQQIDAVLTREIVIKTPENKITGETVITREVMKNYITRLVEYDLQRCPFTVMGLEKQFVSSINVNDNIFELKGYIDRYDLRNGQLEVMDYKTGHISKLSIGNIEDLFDSESKDKSRAAILQVLIYAMALKQDVKYPIVPQVIAFRSINSHESFDIKLDGKPLNFDQLNNTFTSLLSGQIAEMFNPPGGYTQTAVTERCQYCDYKNICRR